MSSCLSAGHRRPHKDLGCHDLRDYPRHPPSSTWEATRASATQACWLPQVPSAEEQAHQALTAGAVTGTSTIVSILNFVYIVATRTHSAHFVDAVTYPRNRVPVKLRILYITYLGINSYARISEVANPR